MINNLAILFSLAVVAFAILRAAKLDRTLPWFGKQPPIISKIIRR